MKRKTRRVLIVVLCILLVFLLGAAAAVGLHAYQKNKAAEAEEETVEEAAEDAEEETAEVTEEAESEEEPEVTEEVTVTEEPEVLVADTPEPTPETNGKMVAIDAGHQEQGNNEQEPIGPGASTTKAKVASGTHGWTTGVPEYELTLAVSLKLRDELESRGYEVYMIRETNDVNISNAERASLAAESGSDILIRVHANGSENTSVNGALTMSPSSSNPYLDSALISECQTLSSTLIEAYCAATGANNQGVIQTDTMSGLNWCTIPATIIEIGYMTNETEDVKMQTEEYQTQMASGIADGIDAYFGF